MLHKIKHPYLIVILLGLLVPMVTKADIWPTPKVKTYYSENKAFKLVIRPRKVSPKYDTWDYYQHCPKQPHTKKFLRQKKRFMRKITAQDTILTPCTATLYQINGQDSTLVWEQALLNKISPTDAIVANDGSSIATFDNWYSKGYGEHVFVIYNQDGLPQKTYKLEDISPFSLNDYEMSISSTHWYAERRYIDNKRIEIIFIAAEGKTKRRIYNIEKLDFED